MAETKVVVENREQLWSLLIQAAQAAGRSSSR
jgi:hypothetical protein